MASFLPIHFVGTIKTGRRTRETSVICQDSVIIAITTKSKVSELLTIPESVDVKAC